MPKSNWADYNCKVLIFSDPNTFSTARARDTWGYLYIIPEQYGFGDYVKIIVQPPGVYYDVSPQANSQTDDPFQMVKLYSSKRTNRFIIPDIYDVMIEFEPRSDDPGYTDEAQDATTKGTFKVSAQHISKEEAEELANSEEKPFAGNENVEEDKRDIMLKELIVYVPLLEEKADGEYTEFVRDTTDYSDVLEYFEEIPNQDDLPTAPEAASEETGGAPEWFETIYNEKVLFSLGGRDVTMKETFWAASGTLIIILICVAICLAVSYWKRKRIAAEARRASNYVRRSTATLRASIRKARGKPTPEDEAKPMTDQEINKVANDQGANKNEKEMLKDMMHAQNEGGQIEMSKWGTKVSPQ